MNKRVKTLWILLTVAALICRGAVCVAADGNETDVYYAKSLLEGGCAYVYERLEQELLSPSPCLEISLDESMGVTADELSYAVQMFLSDHPECFWVGGGYGYSSYEDGRVVSVTMQPSVNVSDIPVMRAQLESVVESIISSVPEGDSYAKALYLHDVLASHTEYVQEGLHQTAYGALVSGRAVCAGYASAYQLLLQRIGICAFKVSGSSIEPNSGIAEPHAWTLVMIEEGVCVYTDVTWDDQGDELYREYFCRTLEDFSLTHAEDKSLYDLPECSHEGYGYFEKKGGIFDDTDGVQKLSELFYADGEDVRAAKIYYLGDDLGDFLNGAASELYALLGGKGSFSYSTTSLGREIHITLTGDFSEAGETPTPPTEPEIPDFDKNPDVEMPTDAPVGAPTEEPTNEPTEAPTNEPTEEPTNAPTEAPTNEPTEAPTNAPTEAPTSAPTEAPTDASTEAPTDAPTEAPTDAPTDAPTQEPNPSGCGMSISAMSVMLPLAVGLALVLKRRKNV